MIKKCLLILLLSSCSDSIIRGPVIDRELMPYVHGFMEDCHRYGADLSAAGQLQRVSMVNDIEGDNVGVCWTHMSRSLKLLWYSTIEVTKMGSEIEQQALIYHELGHCVLGLDHVPDSIMAPFILDKPILEAKWDKLVEGLCLRYP